MRDIVWNIPNKKSKKKLAMGNGFENWVIFFDTNGALVAVFVHGEIMSSINFVTSMDGQTALGILGVWFIAMVVLPLG